MNLSVILTVHDREPELLINCLRSLYVCGLKDAQLVVVDDRSHMDYGWAKDYIKSRFPSSKWQATGNYHGYRTGSFGNPSRAFNVGLLAATQSTVVLMSSDVLLTTKAGEAIQRAQSYDCPWTPRVVDLDSGREYCGPTRFFPMPWCLVAPREACLAVGGWDEAYLNGLCYEDNDFVGRLGLHCGKILADWQVTVWHQSHFQPAYVFDDQDIGAANERNRMWTMDKWSGGVPFDHEKTPFDIRRKPDPSGLASLTFHGGQLERAVELTTGLVCSISSH